MNDLISIYINRQSNLLFAKMAKLKNKTWSRNIILTKQHTTRRIRSIYTATHYDVPNTYSTQTRGRVIFRQSLNWRRRSWPTERARPYKAELQSCGVSRSRWRRVRSRISALGLVTSADLHVHRLAKTRSRGINREVGSKLFDVIIFLKKGAQLTFGEKTVRARRRCLPRPLPLSAKHWSPSVLVSWPPSRLTLGSRRSSRCTSKRTSLFLLLFFNWARTEMALGNRHVSDPHSSSSPLSLNKTAHWRPRWAKQRLTVDAFAFE